jgi:hypothetical protein
VKRFANWNLAPGARRRVTVDARPWLEDGRTLTVFDPTAPTGLTVETPMIAAGLDVEFWLSCASDLPTGRIFIVPVRVEDSGGERDFQEFQVQLV